MKMQCDMPHLKGFRYPREIIAYAVWAHHRFTLSTADVEDLLAEHGVIVSREAVRLWVNRFGRHFAQCVRRDRPRPNDKWHLDEVVITIRGKKHWLWRAIDADGDVLDILVQTRRNAKAAKRFLQRLIRQFGDPRVVITDKLRSYIKPIHMLASQVDHRLTTWQYLCDFKPTRCTAVIQIARTPDSLIALPPRQAGINNLAMPPRTGQK